VRRRLNPADDLRMPRGWSGTCRRRGDQRARQRPDDLEIRHIHEVAVFWTRITSLLCVCASGDNTSEWHGVAVCFLPDRNTIALLQPFGGAWREQIPEIRSRHAPKTRRAAQGATKRREHTPSAQSPQIRSICQILGMCRTLTEI